MIDKRQYLRKDLNYPVIVTFNVEGMENSCCFGQVTENISNGGVGLQSRYNLIIGQKIILKLNLNRTILCKGIIAWKKKDPHNDMWSIGIQFINLDEKLFQEIGQFIEQNQNSLVLEKQYQTTGSV